VSRAFLTTAHDYGRPLLVAFTYTNALAGLLSDTVPLGTPIVVTMIDRETGTMHIDRAPGTIVSSTAGRVVLRYDFASGELDEPAELDATFECAATGGAITLPSTGAVPVLIGPDLDG